MKHFVFTIIIALCVAGCTPVSAPTKTVDVQQPSVPLTNSAVAEAADEQATTPPEPQKEAEEERSAQEEVSATSEAAPVDQASQVSPQTTPQAASPEVPSTPTRTPEPEVTPENPQILIEMTVVSPGKSQRYSASVEAGSTVESLMKKLADKGLQYSTKGYGGIGTYISTMNGLAEDRRAGFYWIYYLNGSRATAGISLQTLKKGDTIKWNYEKEL